MAEPIVVTVSHTLGAAEAQRRIARGLEKGRTELASLFSAFDADWKANHADLRLVALNQQITAGLDVFDDMVRVELSLPWYLAPLQDKIAGALKRQSEKSLQIGQG
ncbi:MAG: polyhydroxyalkanoic acid system family protein [Methylobacteriaceae bacterium]|nr:polyhydroxyalkanoic acid system family protein [Methylobacteriaceae bacterium]